MFRVKIVRYIFIMRFFRTCFARECEVCGDRVERLPGWLLYKQLGCVAMGLGKSTDGLPCFRVFPRIGLNMWCGEHVC